MFGNAPPFFHSSPPLFVKMSPKSACPAFLRETISLRAFGEKTLHSDRLLADGAPSWLCSLLVVVQAQDGLCLPSGSWACPCPHGRGPRPLQAVLCPVSLYL